MGSFNGDGGILRPRGPRRAPARAPDAPPARRVPLPRAGCGVIAQDFAFVEIKQISCGITTIMGRGRDAGGTNRTERARASPARRSPARRAWTRTHATFLPKAQITLFLR